MRLYGVVEHGDRIEVAYQQDGSDMWIGVMSYGIASKATAIAHAHALRQGIDITTKPLTRQEKIDASNSEYNWWKKRQASGQRDFFREDPPEDKYESSVSSTTDPDNPF